MNPDDPEASIRLETARRLLDGVVGVGHVGDIQLFQGHDRFGVSFDIEIEAASEDLPARTAWWLVVGPRFPNGLVEVYPSKTGGITATFPHQDVNTPGEDALPWRDGDICLKGPESFLGRGVSDPDPVGKQNRLVSCLEERRNL